MGDLEGYRLVLFKAPLWCSVVAVFSTLMMWASPASLLPSGSQGFFDLRNVTCVQVSFTSDFLMLVLGCFGVGKARVLVVLGGLALLLIAVGGLLQNGVLSSGSPSG